MKIKKFAASLCSAEPIRMSKIFMWVCALLISARVTDSSLEHRALRERGFHSLADQSVTVTTTNDDTQTVRRLQGYEFTNDGPGGGGTEGGTQTVRRLQGPDLTQGGTDDGGNDAGTDDGGNDAGMVFDPAGLTISETGLSGLKLNWINNQIVTALKYISLQGIQMKLLFLHIY